jgi:hypothetical protein
MGNLGKGYLKYAVFLCFFLCGCATYNIKEEKNGFVFTRYKKLIPEYTVGAEGSFPGKELARERFERRRKSVEYYYKKMGFIDNRFKQDFIEPPVIFIKFLFGILRVPFIIISDYKYDHNPQYKEMVDKLEDQRYEAERTRIKDLKEELASYIKEDLAKESYLQSAPDLLQTPKKIIQPQSIGFKEELSKTVSSKIDVSGEARVKEPIKDPSRDILVNPIAMITAKPLSGPSPLKVSFSGSKSKSLNGRIISYQWDFGDGDKSNKPNPTNTYWSATYGTREYTATLTVTDRSGVSSSSSIAIQVVNE